MWKMLKKLFLEPHYGDIAWSCGGLLAQNKQESIILNIFPPRSKFFRIKFRFIKYNRRKKNEKRFEKLFGIKIFYLSFKSAFLRGRTLETLFDKELNRIEHSQVLELRNIIIKFIDDYNVSEIYCPMAQRNQVDHLIVNKAVKGITAHDVQIYYYEDFPNFLPESKKYLQNKDAKAIRKDISDVIDEKIEAVLIYKSLIREHYKSIEGLVKLIKDTPYETFWIEEI